MYMGLKLEICSGFYVFGIRQMRVLFNSGGMIIELKTLIHVSTTDSSVSFLYFLKIMGCTTLGPGDFIDLKDKMSLLTSYVVRRQPMDYLA